MVKLLLCIFSAIAIALSMHHLQHQKMVLNYRTNQAHKSLQNLQIELWNQQLQVAIYTAPNAIERTVGSHKIELKPANPTEQAQPASSSSSDAE